MASTTLFPPIVSQYQSTFMIEEGVLNPSFSLKFEISQFNNSGDFNHNLVQVKLSTIGTNQSILKPQDYPNEIYICGCESSDGKNFTINIPLDVLKSTLTKGVYYRAQIRLTESGISSPQAGEIAEWLNDQEDHFSDWSTITLFCQIDEPEIIFSIENGILNNYGFHITFGNSSNPQDQLLKYQILIKLKDSQQQSPDFTFEDSQIIFSNKNDIAYQAKKILPSYITPREYDKYYITLRYWTQKGYNGEENFPDNPEDIPSFTQSTKFDVLLKENEQYGGVAVNIIAKTAEIAMGSLFRVFRTSYQSNFLEFDEIFSVEVEERAMPVGQIISLIDNTVESDVLYKYLFILKIPNSLSTEYLYPSAVQKILLEDSFLTDENKTFKVCYNEDLGSYKINTSENISTTLGSKYPFFAKSGIISYVTFSLSGLITYLGDKDIDESIIDSTGTERDKIKEYSLMLTKQDAYGSVQSIYDNANKDKTYDIYFERLYREQVVKFLMNTTVKLFRSATEGNILVMLTGVSFAPDKQSARRLYTFSSTATEMDECSVANYKKYGILPTEPYKYYPPEVEVSAE